jgi:hypothetical protein
MDTLLVVLIKVGISRKKYDKRYMCFCFANIFVTGEKRRPCVICQKTLSAESLKPSRIKRHLEIRHADLAIQTSRCFIRRTAETQRRESS